MSPRLRALLARRLSSTAASERSSTTPPTGTTPASELFDRPASPSGSTYRRGTLHGIYQSSLTGKREYYESSYELRRFRALDASPLVRYWTKSHGLKLRYRLYGRKRRYWPDILVFYNDGRIYLEEIKGHIFRQREFVKKKWAAQAYCGARRWKYRILFEADLETVE